MTIFFLNWKQIYQLLCVFDFLLGGTLSYLSGSSTQCGSRQRGDIYPDACNTHTWKVNTVDAKRFHISQVTSIKFIHKVSVSWSSLDFALECPSSVSGTCRSEEHVSIKAVHRDVIVKDVAKVRRRSAESPRLGAKISRALLWLAQLRVWLSRWRNELVYVDVTVRSYLVLLSRKRSCLRVTIFTMANGLYIEHFFYNLHASFIHT